MIEVKQTSYAGRGVFATRDIRRGTLITLDPVLVLCDDDHEIVDTTVVGQYTYEWADGGSALALGPGSLLNHSKEPNARFRCFWDDKKIGVYAKKNIAKGDEILIDYGYKVKF